MSRLLGAAVLVAGILWGQTFEVASIRPADPALSGRYIRMTSVNRFYARNHSLKTLVEAAYNLSPRAVLGGPGWIDSEKYEIQAKTPGERRPGNEEQMAMLRGLLAERFQLKFHREEREMAVYTLSVAKGGVKMKPSEGVPEGPAEPLLAFVLAPRVVTLPGRGVTMAEMIGVLQRAALDRPVVDETGLGGQKWDFDLRFRPDESLFGGALKLPEGSDEPDFFQAMERQLGLKLAAGRGPVMALVIDRVERPEAN